MRTDQFMGLNARAKALLALDESVVLCEKRIMRRYPDGSETDTGWVSETGSRTKIEEYTSFIGAFDSTFGLYRYILSDGRTFREEIQCQPWSSGPMYFIALKDENGWVKESLWTNDDPGSENLIYNLEEQNEEEAPIGL